MRVLLLRPADVDFDKRAFEQRIALIMRHLVRYRATYDERWVEFQARAWTLHIETQDLGVQYSVDLGPRTVDVT